MHLVERRRVLVRRPFRRLLVANRGEIAVRILRAARELGLETIAIYSDADLHAPHVALADHAIPVGPAPASDSYLNIRSVLDAARQGQAEAVHPGYGFLSENPDFAAAVEDAGLVFVGPTPESMRQMGDKSAARRIAESAGVPVVPGYDGDDASFETLLAEARRIGFPLLCKPAAGGGGKGMRRVDSEDQLASVLEASRREARSAFGDDRIILERFLRPIRHVEIQIFADSHGNTIHLFERECSVQRRHQKIIEEAPSPGLGPTTRQKMGAAAVALARSVGYRGAGTVEFVLDEQERFYFLEMNTRLQVEHPVTESVTGIDLARLQLREARGERLELAQEDLSLRGHAIEARIYAEDPGNGFLPAAGHILLLSEPVGPGVRFDSGVRTGSEVSVHYDPILAKLIVWAEDRDHARERMMRALDETVVLGLQTNVRFLREVVEHPAFAHGDTWTDFIDRHLASWSDRPPALAPEVLALAAIAQSPRTTRSDADVAPRSGDPYSPWEVPDGFRAGGNGGAP